MGSDGIVDFYETDRDDDEYNYDYAGDVPEDEYEEVQCTEKKHSGNRSLLLTFIQLIVCAILIGGAFVVRTIGGSIHGAVGTWFFEHYNSTIFTGEAPSIQKQSDSVAVTENSVPAAQNSVSPEKADNAPEPA